MRSHSSHAQGFSFLELSILLVAIALLTGAILVGKTLIHSTELRSVVADVDKFSAATVAFKDKYKYLPGDFPRATDIWGTNPGCGHSTTPSITTCNGNGNNIVDDSMTLQSLEVATFWNQLADAGLIEGQYSVYPADPNGPGISLPKSKITGAGYGLAPPATSVFDTWDTAGTPHMKNYTFVLTTTKSRHCVWGTDFIGCTSGYAPAITPEDSSNLDTKMDDGKPGYGLVTADYSGSGAFWSGCITTDQAATAVYNTANTNIACPLLIDAQF